MAFTDTRLRYGDSTLTRTPDLVRWGPVVAGVIIGLGFFALLNSLWFAVAYSSGGGWVGGNLSWFVGGTAALSLLIAGGVAGALAGVRGMLAGLVNGMAAWGLLFILSVTAVLPGALNLTGAGMPQGVPIGPAGQGLTAASALWTAFWSLLVGLALAAGGGILGGRMRRPVTVDEEPPPPVQRPAPGRERVDDGAGRTEVLDERGEVHGVPHR